MIDGDWKKVRKLNKTPDDVSHVDGDDNRQLATKQWKQQQYEMNTEE